MMIDASEFHRLQYLLGKHSLRGLDNVERMELRTLLERAMPSLVPSDWDAVVEAGLVYVGARSLLEDLRERAT